MRKFNVTVNGKQYFVEIEETSSSAPAAPAAPAQQKKQEVKKPASAGKVNIEAPMPGNILDVRVSAGASVKAGDVICILEAMKMENEIVAPQDGVVASVVAKGATVNTGDILASLE